MSFVKYRLKEVAADFGVAPKEIVEIISKYYEKPKSNTQVLSSEELNLVFDYMTQHNQITSLEQVFAVKPKEAPKAEAPKAEPVKTAPQQPGRVAPQQPGRPQQPSRPQQGQNPNARPAQNAGANRPAPQQQAQPQKPVKQPEPERKRAPSRTTPVPTPSSCMRTGRDTLWSWTWRPSPPATPSGS